MAPAVRSVLWISWRTATGRRSSRASLAASMRRLSSFLSNPWSWAWEQYRATRAGASTSVRSLEKSSPPAFQWSMALRVSRQSVRPTISLTVRNPRSAMISRICSATNVMKWMTCSGLPVNCLRSSASCVATPTEQVLRWHLRSMMQPLTTRAVVANPNSSAPSRQATATSLPVFNCPSVCTTMRPRRSFCTSTCWVSATPSSQGMPACFMEDSGEAPVPPS